MTEPGRAAPPVTAAAGSPPGRRRLPHRRVTCAEVSHPTPNLVRILATGQLADWDPAEPGAHLKVFVPEGDGGELAMRTYTVRAFDADRGELTLEFGLHADGPATAWASAAGVGDEFEISGLARSGYVPGEGTDWVLLVGDHAALPALAAVAQSLSGALAATALVELTDPADRLPLSSEARLETRWLQESGEPCEQLVAAVQALELPAGSGEVWVGCEAGAMRQIRHHLLRERGLAASMLHTRAYWKRHTANHPDHDTGAEDD